MKRVIVSGPFDDLRFNDFRFLEEASKLGAPLHVLLWSDAAIQSLTGKPPKFPQAEREYLVQAIRYVKSLHPFDAHKLPDALPALGELVPTVWAVTEASNSASKRQWAESQQINYQVIRDRSIMSAPSAPPVPNRPQSDRKKVVVTGCYDWFHSGHVRFFEECSELGELYVVVGHDQNIRLLKGEGHPLFPALLRRYVVGSIKYVKLALVSSGNGWMDAEPEFTKIQPDIYAVNEDGDKVEKRQFCEKHGIEYRVLRRLPKSGLPRRQSTELRGF